MAVGERLKMARDMAGLSQRKLAEKVDVSAMAISKYERGLDMPSSGVLIRLAQALGANVEYLLRPVSVSVPTPVYRKRASLSAKDEKAILARAQEWLERYLDVEMLFGEPPCFHPPDINRAVADLEDIERVALELRQDWELGLGPIDNLVEALEARGIKVGLIVGAARFDALTLKVDGAPVVVADRELPGDRQRFSVAHELGHLILEPGDGVDAEKAAHRFAGAFLVPKPAALLELGPHRRELDPFELHLLKHKYGLSMQAWIYRAKDLGIISESAAVQMFREFRRKRWYREEPGDAVLAEKPERMKRLILRALAEDAISRSRAAEMLGMPILQFWREEAKAHGEFPLPVRG